ncbi:MAG: peptidoglycan-binding protein [Gemmatimonadales bacterium]
MLLGASACREAGDSAESAVRTAAATGTAVLATPGADADPGSMPGVEVDLERLLWARHPPTGIPNDLWPALREVYDRGRYEPLWIGRLARLAALAEAACWLDSIGLPSAEYFPDELFEDRNGSGAPPAELDLRASAGVVAGARALARGILGPAEVAGWRVARPSLPEALPAALLADSAPAGRLRGLAPRHPGYGELLPHYHRYRALAVAAAWPHLVDGPPLRRGDTGQRVGALRGTLAASGDGSATLLSGEPRFDRDVERAVARFQTRHGLPATGTVGVHTLAALQVPPEQRALAIAANLERYRWMPRGARSSYSVAELFRDGVRLRLGGAGGATARRPSTSLAGTAPAVAESTWTLLLGAGRVAPQRHLGLRVAGDTVIVPRDKAAGVVALLRAGGLDSVEAVQAAAAGAGDTAAVGTPLFVLAPTTWADGDALMVRTDTTGADTRLMVRLRGLIDLRAPSPCRTPARLAAGAGGETPR